MNIDGAMRNFAYLLPISIFCSFFISRFLSMKANTPFFKPRRISIDSVFQMLNGLARIIRFPISRAAP